MRPLIPALEAQAAMLAIVGCGSPAQALDFAARAGFTDVPRVRVLTDPTGSTQAAAGLRRGLWPLLHPRSWWEAARAFVRGHRQSRVAGDPLQFGGTLVVARGGRVAFAHAARSLGDHAPAEAILTALRSASSA